jgi:hypothetical protein
MTFQGFFTGVEAADLSLEWDLCFTGLAGGLGDEQQTRIRSRGSKNLLIIPIFFEGLNILLFKKNCNIFHVQFPDRCISKLISMMQEIG